MKKKLVTFYVAGVKHHVHPLDMAEIGDGDQIFLLFEPDNEYDKNAIRTEHDVAKMIGYVPKKVNKEVGALLASRSVWAEVIECKPDADPWRSILVGIFSETIDTEDN